MLETMNNLNFGLRPLDGKLFGNEKASRAEAVKI